MGRRKKEVVERKIMNTLVIDDEGNVNFYQTEEDIRDFEEEPSPYGFYHFNDNIKPATAFHRLKNCKIDYLKERIVKDVQEYNRQIDILKKLKWKDDAQHNEKGIEV